MLWMKVVSDGTGTKKKGNYVWSVGVNENVLAEGKAKGHQRAKGWKKLLKKVTNAAMKVPTREQDVDQFFAPELELPFTPEHAT